jgi:hypothetical protein
LLIENFVVKKQARRRFIQRIRSQSRDIAVDAIESLRAEKWDQDESLRGQNYTRITIKEAPFYDFDLQRVNFERSILHGAHFDGCDLLGAIFRSTELSAAIFKGTNLHGADFADAELDNNTILPDGSKYNPEEGSKQLRRFTDPDYSDPENPDPKKHVFWRPQPNEHGEYLWWYRPEDEIDQV